MVFEEITNGLYPQKYNNKIIDWLKKRYGNQEGEKVWEQTKQNYLSYYEDLPDYGGKKNGHAAAIYGGILVFALYRSLPDHPPIEELQEFIQDLFMEPFMKLGKIFDLNKKSHMRLIDLVFHRVGKRDRKDILKYPEGFVNVNEPYDSERKISRYMFIQCPNAEFAKKHDLLDVLPLLCNCDYFGIEQIQDMGRL
ncbi:MAG: L-2-amino-thiazoline-4-carboxylic acid hydrolase [Erysipelotrichaceae bacterium]|nr:L-2-amino-thiazoline-4-carboxylic acid hydrolase [Erysipelotrichaceae bacterium]